MTIDKGAAASEFVRQALEGEIVRLEPIRPEHAAILWHAAKDSAEELFRWYPWSMGTRDDFGRYIENALAEQRAGTSVGFATVLRESGQPVGSSRFMNIDASNRRLEIGSTWIIPRWQKTAVNTEAKFLMLGHAFERWGCLRVEFKTDSLNAKSREALLRLGAKEEGTLRKHMVTGTGRARDSVYFSIVDTEWPQIKMKLAARLGR